MKIDFFNLAADIGMLGKKLGQASFTLILLIVSAIIIFNTINPILAKKFLYLLLTIPLDRSTATPITILFLFSFLHIIGIFTQTIRRE